MKALKLSIVFLFLLSGNLFARHIIGGELSYRCLGGDNYVFTMCAYRDCFSNGANFDSAPGSLAGTVTLFRGTEVVSVSVLPSPTIEIIDLNDGPHPCPDNTNLCIEKGSYVFNFNLPISEEAYTISYQRCCRTGTISNIVNPEEAGMTFTITINERAQTDCNNSPQLNQMPAPIACVNQEIELDLSAIDPDGDILEYSFCAPNIGGGLAGTGTVPGNATDPNGVAPDPETPPPYDQVLFVEPIYTPEKPLGSNITIDKNTGLVSGTPEIIGQFAFGLCIEEYRDNVLLSTVKRDYQINVVECDTTIIPCTPIVSINELNSETSELEIFPNPASDFINVNLSSSKIQTLKIYDIHGALIKEKHTDLEQTNIVDLESGIYFLVVEDEQSDTFSSKLFKE